MCYSSRRASLYISTLCHRLPEEPQPGPLLFSGWTVKFREMGESWTSLMMPGGKTNCRMKMLPFLWYMLHMLQFIFNKLHFIQLLWQFESVSMMHIYDILLKYVTENIIVIIDIFLISYMFPNVHLDTTDIKW